MTLTDRVNVLLVDDQPTHLLLMEAVLADMGASLVCAGSGEAALEAVADTDFAVILLDVRMPGMDGFEAARRIRALPRSRLTPIIFVTADEGASDVDAAYALGAVDVLAKPLAPAAVRGKVAFFIELFRSKQELTTERAFLTAVLASVEDGIVACDAEGVLTLFNRASQRFHGLPAEPLPPKEWASRYGLLHADGKTPLQQHEIPLVRALGGERLRGVKLVIAPRDGPPRTVISSGGPLVDDHGRKLGAVVSMHDLTAREEARAAREMSRELQAANARMAAIFEQSPAFMCVLRGPEHVFEMVNERYQQLVGRRELIGRPLQEALPEVVEQGFVRQLHEVYLSGEPYAGVGVPVQLRRGPGEALQSRLIDFSYVPLRDGNGVVTGVLVHGVDQTERQLAEQSLAASRKRYQDLLDAIDEGFCLIEVLFDDAGQATDYRYLEVNPAFEKQTGLTAVVGHRVREYLPEHEAQWFRTYGDVVRTGQPVRFLSHSKGLGRWFDVYAAPVGAHGSHVLAVLFNDITARKQAEDELRRLAQELSDADRRKNEFLATLAHELRNPLAPLRNGLQVMRLAAGNPAAVAKAQDMMERQLGHMVHLVNDLLDVARISSGKLDLRRRRVSLKTVISSAMETSLPLIEKGRHELKLDMAEEDMAVSADPTRLAQVVGNLLNNAAKYTPPGGCIGLAMRREGDSAVVQVSDNGIGIAAESLQQVFEMFAQVSEDAYRVQGGLGIGLSLVRRLVELHGGSVSASSEGPGRGATFTVRLPLADEAPPGEAPALPGEPRAAGGRLRVLVVDDNLDAAESLAMLLRLGEHEVSLAADGAQALRAAQASGPDVVFLDIGLPDMSGYDVARALRERPGGARLLLVALTGWGAEDDRARSRAAGFDHHLTKPADPETVERLLAERLGAAA